MPNNRPHKPTCSYFEGAGECNCATVTKITDSTSCGTNVDDHVAQIIAILSYNGISLSCREVHKAMQIIVAANQLCFGHATDFDPTEKANTLYEQTLEVYTTYKAQEAQRRTMNYNGEPSADAVAVIPPGSKFTH